MGKKRFSYPVLLSLSGKRSIVVGGGSVAADKVRGLIRGEAKVTAIAPEFRPRFPKRGVEWIRRGFRASDLNGASLAIAATDDPKVQARVVRAARTRGILLNVVDVPGLCDFAVPSVIRKGRVSVTVSTAGVAPGLSKTLRKRLEKRLPKNLPAFLRILEEAREKVRARFATPAERMKRMRKATSEEMLSLFGSRGAKAVRRAIDRIIVG